MRMSMAGSGVVICTVLEQVVPLARNFGKDRIQVCGAIAAKQFARLLPIFRLAQKEHDFRACARAQVNRSL